MVQAGLRGWEYAKGGDVAAHYSAGATRRLAKDRLPLLEQVHTERQTRVAAVNLPYSHGRIITASGTEGKRAARIAHYGTTGSDGRNGIDGG